MHEKITVLQRMTITQQWLWKLKAINNTTKKTENQQQ